MKRIRRFFIKLFKTPVEPIKQTDPELVFLEKYVKIAKHHCIKHMMISLEDYNKLKELCLKNNGKNPDFKIIPEFELVPNKIIPERYEYKGISFSFSITLDVY